MKNIAYYLHRPYWLHIPQHAIKLVLGEMSAVLLNGQFVVPRKLLNLGFAFKYATIEQALHDVLSPH
jgi:NAD dependent epimerase/dehydratase family enzyme